MNKPRSVHTKKEGPSKEEQIQTLLAWAQEMGFSTDQLPHPHDIKLLFRGRPAESTWKYITGHIHPLSTVENIRKNLLLHTGTASNQQSRTLVERAELVREISSLQLAVSQTTSDISCLESDIVTLEAANALSKSELTELSKKNILLSAHYVKCQEMVNVLKEFSKRIQRREEVFRFTEKEKSYFTRDPPSNKASNGIKLETACKREMRLVCNQLEEIVRLVSSDEQERVTTELDRVRGQAWSKVETLLSTYPPRDVLDSLIKLTQEMSECIHQETQNIDLARDAQQLQYQGDHLGSLQGSNLIQSLEDHLMHAQMAHVTRSLECERAQVQATDIQVSLDKVKGQVEQCIGKQYRNDPEGRELTSLNFQLALEVSGLEGALSALSQYISRLQASQSDKRRAVEELNNKKKKIKDFNITAESRDTQIKDLIKHNSAGKGQLLKQQAELSLYIRERVCDHEVQLVSGARSLLDSVRTELQLSSRISLARVTKTPILNVGSNELSIYCLCPHQLSGCLDWQDLISMIGLKPYSSPENICQSLVDFLNRAAGLSNDIDEYGLSLAKMKTLAKGCNEAQGVLAACHQYDRHLLEEGVPLINLCLSKASKGLAQCSSVEQTLKEWWEQPSQYCVPWVTYDGMSCDKWVEQWKVLTAKLRQLSSQP